MMRPKKPGHPTLSFLVHLLPLSALAACAPALPPPADPPPSAPAAPRAATADGHSAPAPASDASCEAACRAIEGCTGHSEQDCRSSCQAELAPRARSEPYLTCVKALSCEDIRASMTMNAGPLGYCFTRQLPR